MKITRELIKERFEEYNQKYFRFRSQCRRLKREFGIDVLTLPDVVYIKNEYSPKLWERIILWLIDR